MLAAQKHSPHPMTQAAIHGDDGVSRTVAARKGGVASLTYCSHSANALPPTVRTVVMADFTVAICIA